MGVERKLLTISKTSQSNQEFQFELVTEKGKGQYVTTQHKTQAPNCNI